MFLAVEDGPYIIVQALRLPAGAILRVGVRVADENVMQFAVQSPPILLHTDVHLGSHDDHDPRQTAAFAQERIELVVVEHRGRHDARAVFLKDTNNSLKHNVKKQM